MTLYQCIQQPSLLMGCLNFADCINLSLGEQHLRVKKLLVQHQHGTPDCRLFALAFASKICSGGDAPAVCFDQKEMQKHLSKCLTKQVMKPFPKATSEPFPLSIEKLNVYTAIADYWRNLTKKMVECT